MPDWVTEFRPNQYEIIEQINEAFQSVDVVFLQAPTGTGKSLIGECSRRLIAGDSIYTCTTKALQDQFMHDFPYAKVIKGRSNYLTEAGIVDQFGNRAPSHYKYSAVTCADCTFTPSSGECRWCSSKNLCPYTVAKKRAEQSELAVLNTSYLFTVASKVKVSPFLNRDLAIMDEADTLEDELLNHIEVAISNRRMGQMSMDPPAKKTVESSWLDWVTAEALPKTRKYLASLPDPHARTTSADSIKEHGQISELLQRLINLEKELPLGGWIYDGYDKGDCVFRPIKVGRYGNDLLWPHARKFLLMSATILSADLMAEELGLTGSYQLIDIPSNFPVENRQVHVVPIADMTFKNKEQSWPKMAEGVRAVANKHSDERILIHTVSYDLAQYLCDALDSSRAIIYRDSRSKQDALTQYKQSRNGILFAASMDRGIDLPDDLCRVQVVAKIPYPNTKDKRISARMHSSGGKGWYNLQTIRKLIQMTGRGVRSETDWATTYILDSQFNSNIGKADYLFPQWWKDALNYRMSPNKLLRYA